MVTTNYEDIIVEVKGQIGIIRFNRPKALNSFGGKLLQETINAVRELNEHPETVFTVLTGEGRFFSAGADIRGGAMIDGESFDTDAEAKLAFSRKLFPGKELVRSLIDHKKVFILALNGPAVGAGAAWFAGIADITLAADNCYLQVPFSALGLVPENGAARQIAQSIGVQRTNEFLMFGRKMTAQELEQWGLFSKVFPVASFQDDVQKYLQHQLDTNDGESMMISKQLQNGPLRNERLIALYDAADALAERFVDGAPVRRFALKIEELEEKSKNRSKL